MQAQPIVLGTAGHIDHGKTALVRALTGIDTDRLKVEKERGITTELGFAHLDLGGRRFGFVDVPGHERFIRAMVSGAGGLDLVCLVVAADEGIMPQTREHLDICDLLAVRRGVVVLTKADLVDEEWIELASVELREALEGSFLAEAAIVPVSAKTGQGLDDLRAELIRLTGDLVGRDDSGVFRLPLDRVFTIKGFGTVVTGTVSSGTISVGDNIEVHPSGKTAKVRGIEVHGSPAESARAGTRCAINLSGIGIDELGRGDTLSHPGQIAPTHIIDANFRYLKTSKAALPRRSKVLLHHTTAQYLATLVLVDRDQLAPGEHAPVQLRLDATTPVPALPGDHFIVRGFTVQEHYGTTLGGGEILRVHAAKVRRPSEEAAAALERLASAKRDERVALEVKSHAAAGTTPTDIVHRLGYGSDDVQAICERLIASGELLAAGTGSGAVVIHGEHVAVLEKRIMDALAAHEVAEPHKPEMAKEALRASLPAALPAKIFDELLAGLGRRRAIETEAEFVRRPHKGGAGRQAATGLSPLEARVAERYAAWGLEALRPKEVAGEVGSGERETQIALDALVKRGTLVKIKHDYLVDANALSALEQKLRSFLAEHGQITPPEWKDLAGVSRKFGIPLAEHFDAVKVTLRIGDIRKPRG